MNTDFRKMIECILDEAAISVLHFLRGPGHWRLSNRPGLPVEECLMGLSVGNVVYSYDEEAQGVVSDTVVGMDEDGRAYLCLNMGNDPNLYVVDNHYYLTKEEALRSIKVHEVDDAIEYHQQEAEKAAKLKLKITTLLLVLMLSSVASADALLLKSGWNDWAGELQGHVLLDANDSVTGGWLTFGQAPDQMRVDGGTWDGHQVDLFGKGCVSSGPCTPDTSMTFDGLLRANGELMSGSSVAYWDTSRHPIGDSSLDGVFDSEDMLRVFQRGEYEDRFPNNSSWVSGDWNADNEFDSGDMLFAFQEGNYQKSAIAIPEPTSVWLLLIGVFFLRFRCNRI